MASVSNLSECAICQQELRTKKDPKMLACGHIFHPICIDYALLMQKNQNQAHSCPLCRKDPFINGFSGDVNALIKSLQVYQKVQAECAEYQKTNPEHLTDQEKRYQAEVQSSRSGYFMPRGVLKGGEVYGLLIGADAQMRERARRIQEYSNKIKMEERIQVGWKIIAVCIVAVFIFYLFEKGRGKG